MLQSPRPQWQQTTTQAVDGPVDSLLFEGGFLFCGWHARGSGPPLHQKGCISVWHLSSGAQDQLEGFNVRPSPGSSELSATNAGCLPCCSAVLELTCLCRVQDAGSRYAG